MGHLRRRMSQNRTLCLVLSVSVNFNLLHKAGKAYPWDRPPYCPRCREPCLWGHGYVARYFDGEFGQLWMKRWRCPSCGAVHTMRPRAYWRRFLAPWWLILVSLQQKLVMARWLSLEARQRQQYWMRGYLKQRQAVGGIAEIWDLHELGIIVATHSLTYRVIDPPRDSPYPRFAATRATSYG